MTIKESLKTIFEEYGADIDNKEELLEIDSIKYVAILVEIEKEFDIVIPDEYLNYNAFENINDFINLIEDLVNNLNDNNFSKQTVLNKEE